MVRAGAGRGQGRVHDLVPPRPAHAALRDLRDAGARGERGHLYEYLLRQNPKLYGAAFGIGVEDAIFLTGQLGNDAVDDDELDRVLGSLYAWVERFFPTAIRIGFASRFARR